MYGNGGGTSKTIVKIDCGWGLGSDFDEASRYYLDSDNYMGIILNHGPIHFPYQRYICLVPGLCVATECQTWKCYVPLITMDGLVLGCGE